MELWSFRDESAGDVDIVGFTVEASDGKAGKVDDADYDVGSCCVVIDTGGFRGHKVLLPAGLVEAIDLESETIHVRVAKDDVKGAPDYDPLGVRDDEYRARVASHFEDRGAERETQV
jgi:hypothetical protein